jgi:hypothetical protein
MKNLPSIKLVIKCIKTYLTPDGQKTVKKNKWVDDQMVLTSKLENICFYMSTQEISIISNSNELNNI